MSDIGIILGVAVMCAGVWLWLPPLAIIIGGAGIIAVSAAIGWTGHADSRTG